MTLNHLLSSVQPIATLSSEERIEKLRNDYWIGYSHAEQALLRLEDLLSYPKGGKNAKHAYYWSYQ